MMQKFLGHFLCNAFNSSRSFMSGLQSSYLIRSETWLNDVSPSLFSTFDRISALRPTTPASYPTCPQV